MKNAKKSAKPFVALAEMVQKFVSETPKRFHSRPHDQDHFVPSDKPFSPLQCTIPASPDLATAARSRPMLVVEEEKFPTFKAAPIDPKVFESRGDYGVPRVEKKPCTVPEGFNLTEQRPRQVQFLS